MATISTVQITVFTAYGEKFPLVFDLDRNTVRREAIALLEAYREEGMVDSPSEPTIVERTEMVGVIDGEIFDWNAGDAGPPRPKLHWICPQCGLQQWGDFSKDISNPCLWGSDCRCIDKWLIRWNGNDLEKYEVVQVT